jgi:hypothetical protein
MTWISGLPESKAKLCEVSTADDVAGVQRMT